MGQNWQSSALDRQQICWTEMAPFCILFEIKARETMRLNPEDAGVLLCSIKASEMLVAPRISEYFLKSLKF